MSAYYPDPSWIGSDGLDYRNQDWEEEEKDGESN